MKKVKSRTVRIDRGYGLAESWVVVRVIDERMENTLFSGPQPSLLVEIPGGERVWVSSWEETPTP